MLTAAREAPPAVEERRTEKRGDDEIVVTIYKTTLGRYAFSVQCRLGRFIRAVFPHQNPREYESAPAAKAAAAATLREWTRRSPAAKKRLQRFQLTEPAQLDLF